jgi:hypothetical protein
MVKRGHTNIAMAARVVNFFESFFCCKRIELKYANDHFTLPGNIVSLVKFAFFESK